MSGISIARLLSLLERNKYVPMLMHVAFFVILSLLLLFFYFLLGKTLGVFGYVWLLLISATAVFFGVGFSLVLLLTSLFMQNILIASVTTYDLTDVTEFSFMVGTSFFITCLFSLHSGITWLKHLRGSPSESRKLLHWAIFFSLAVIVYSGLGVVFSDLRSMLSYARVYLGAVMLLMIGIESGYKLPTEFFVSIVRLLAFILVVWGILELFFTKEMVAFFNILDFVHMKYMGARPLVSLQELVEPQPYLNFSGQFGLDLTIPHLKGPNIHPISYGYELSFCSLICFMYRHRILAAACLIMVLLVGAKGAIVLTLASLLFYAFYSVVPHPRLLLLLLASFIILYVPVVIYYGLLSEDFHILGLIGSIHGFLENPLGRGVGVGGNMSTQGLVEGNISDFQQFQKQGSAAFALESGFGVMFYQLGIAALLFVGFYRCLFKSIWKKATQERSDRRMVILPIALIFVLVNSVFQEEAFSPACLGLWLLFSGFFLARAWQEEYDIKEPSDMKI